MEKLITIIAPQLLVAGAYSFIGEIKNVVFELRWMLAFIVVMIVADFVLGIIDSVVKRGEDFRLSRAGRRTMCKFIEYNSYLVLGFMLGIAILQPVGICSYTISSMCGLGLAIVFEFDSIMEHVCEIHGIKTGFPSSGFWSDILRKSMRRLVRLSRKLQRKGKNKKGAAAPPKIKDFTNVNNLMI